MTVNFIIFTFLANLGLGLTASTDFTFPPLNNETTPTPPANTTFTFPPLNSTTPETPANTTFTFPPLNTTTPKAPENTTFTFPPLNTTAPAPTNTTSKFTFPTLHNSTTTGPFTFPPLHSTSATPEGGSDLIPIIVGAALGGLVVIVLAGYIIVQLKNRRQNSENDREKLVQ